MTSPSIVVKTTAKATLKGNYYRCVCACLIPIFIYIAVSLTASVAGMALGNTVLYILLVVMNFFLSVPCFLGFLRFLRRLMWGMQDDIMAVFYYFGSLSLYKKAIWSAFNFFLRLFLLGIAIYSPSLVLSLLSSDKLYEFLGITRPPFIINLVETSSVFTAISSAIYLIVSIRYYLTPFLLVADEDMDIGEALHMSRVISKKSAIDFLALALSFSFWIFISFFMIPTPFTLPYMALAYMIHCRFAVAQYNKVADANRDNIPFYSSEN